MSHDPAVAAAAAAAAVDAAALTSTRRRLLARSKIYDPFMVPDHPAGWKLAARLINGGRLGLIDATCGDAWRLRTKSASRSTVERDELVTNPVTSRFIYVYCQRRCYLPNRP